MDKPTGVGLAVAFSVSIKNITFFFNHITAIFANIMILKLTDYWMGFV
jgi:hypothetical protein